MKLEAWKTYRTRFLVQAKQISSNLTFVDHLGRQHTGRKGDYLVESSDGVLSIAPRRIFEDIYVPMLDDSAAAQPSASESTHPNHELDHANFESLEIEHLTPRKPPTAHVVTTASAVSPKPALSSSNRRSEAEPIAELAPAPAGGRKLPQPYRDRRSSPSRLSLM
jgi:hypothetical protein